MRKVDAGLFEHGARRYNRYFNWYETRYGMGDTFLMDPEFGVPLVYGGGARKAHLIALLDLKSHWAGGWALGPSADHVLALRAVDDLCDHLEALGRSLQDAIIHHDQDAVFTSHAWLRRLLLTEGARVSYTEHGCRENPWTESFWGRLKTEIDAATRDAETMTELTALVAQRMTYYNQRRRHSSLGQVAPWTFLCRALGRREGS